MTTAPSVTSGTGALAGGHVRVAVIGAGFSGLAVAHGPRRAGVDDVVVLERGTTVGGTWRENTCPGCGCDLPSHLYSFSFAPNPAWSYSLQPEILRYLEGLVGRLGLERNVVLGVDVRDATWDDEAARWRLRTRLPLRARWRHDVDLTGKRVAVVGTGASAIQIVPRLQPVAERLVLFQRTPPWVIPKLDRRISGLERALYRRFPATQRAARAVQYSFREAGVPGFVFRPGLMVDVVGALAAVEGNRVVSADGSAHDVDAIVLGTGFDVQDLPVARQVHGREGVALSAVWERDGRGALRSTAVTGFPDLFLTVGPNSGPGHNSMVYIIESQAAYVVDAVQEMTARRLAAIEPDPGAQHRWNNGVRRRMAGTVWQRGGLRELVPGRRRQQHDAVARVHLPVPAADPHHRPARVRATTDRAGGRRRTRRQARPRHRRHPMTAPDLVPPVPRERRTLHGQDGTALNVELYGPDDAPTVVLAHGWTLAIAIWAPLLRAFGDRYRVVAYDQRGHGASGAPGPAGFTAEAIADDLAAVLTGTVPRGEKAVVAGHSMGGMAIVAAAGRHADVVRDRVAAVVLMSTGMHELTARSRIVPMPLPLAKLATPIATALMAMKPPPGRVEGRQRTMTRYVTLSKQATDAQVDFSTRIINACPPETRAGFARMLARIDLDAVVERLAVPAVVVCGDRDRLTPIWHARRMAAVLPQSLGLVTVPGAGHMTPVEAPRAVDGAVRRLVDEHLAVAGPVEPAASAQPAEPVEPAVTIDITTTDEEIAR